MTIIVWHKEAKIKVDLQKFTNKKIFIQNLKVFPLKCSCLLFISTIFSGFWDKIDQKVPISKLIQFLCTNKWPRSVYLVQVLGDQNWTYMVCNSSINLLSQLSDTASCKPLMLSLFLCCFCSIEFCFKKSCLKYSNSFILAFTVSEIWEEEKEPIPKILKFYFKTFFLIG